MPDLTIPGRVLSLGGSHSPYRPAAVMNTADWLNKVQELVPWFQPEVTVGLAAFLLVAVTVIVARLAPPLRRDEARPKVEATFDDRPAAYIGGAPDDEELPAEVLEKRDSRRRKGQPVAVYVALDSPRAKPITGYVLDRSKTGLKLIVNKRHEAGCLIRARAENAPDTFPWVRLEVKRCAATSIRGKWELGCEFQEELAWNVLLSFG